LLALQNENISSATTLSLGGKISPELYTFRFE
jgi:hypothetical protein